MKLIIDVMGFDNSPNEAIKACRIFKSKNPNVEFTLVGNEQEIKQFVKPNDGFTIAHTTDVVHTEENFLETLRNTNTSMHKALTMVANGEGDGVLSAGSSAAFVVLSTMILKTIPGVSKPAFMAFVPTVNKRGTLLLDVGANINVTAEDLVTFARMSNIYCKNVRHIENPSICVLNNGTEKNKGFAYHQEADKILEQNSSINYKGFTESKMILSGECDAIISDGFTGNAALKSMEGALKYMKNEIKVQYKKPWNWLGAIFSLGMVKGLKNTFNYDANAGAFVLGLNKNAVKTHGSAECTEWLGAIRMLRDAVEFNLVEKIAEEFK